MEPSRAIQSALRRVPPWTLYVVGAIWAVWLFGQGLSGALGPEPINALERRYGEIGLLLLVAGLCITPIRDLLGINLIRFRRALGLTAFGFVLAHLSVWAVLDLRQLSRIASELVERPYITLGFAAFLLLVPLAATSNDGAVRRLGARTWRRLHLLTYPAVILAVLHYIWLVKGMPAEPFIYLGIVLLLLVLRLRHAGLSLQRS